MYAWTVSLIVAAPIVILGLAATAWTYCYKQSTCIVETSSPESPEYPPEFSARTTPYSIDTETGPDMIVTNASLPATVPRTPPNRPRKGSLASTWKSVELEYVVTTPSAETGTSDVRVDATI